MMAARVEQRRDTKPVEPRNAYLSARASRKATPVVRAQSAGKTTVPVQEQGLYRTVLACGIDGQPT